MLRTWVRGFFLAIWCVFGIVLDIMVIRMRHNRSQTKQRRSHHALKTPVLSVCSNCGGQHRPHHMCLACGFYNGRQVIDLAAKREARQARMQAKQDAIRSQAEQVVPSEAEEVSQENPDTSNTEPETKKS